MRAGNKPTGTAWALNPLVLPLQWRHWDEDWVLFDAGSGSTHRMNAFAAAVLADLASRGPADSTALAARLADDFELPDEQTLSDALGTLLSQLHHKGLIEPATTRACPS